MHGCGVFPARAGVVLAADPGVFEYLGSWANAHSGGLVGLGVISALLFVVTLASVPYLLMRLPADYFVKPARSRPLGLRMARAFVGSVLVVIGVAMLVLPGQGVLTILFGVTVLWGANNPIVRWLLARPGIRRVLDRMRERAGERPFILP